MPFDFYFSKNNNDLLAICDICLCAVCVERLVGYNAWNNYFYFVKYIFVDEYIDEKKREDNQYLLFKWSLLQHTIMLSKFMSSIFYEKRKDINLKNIMCFVRVYKWMMYH